MGPKDAGEAVARQATYDPSLSAAERFPFRVRDLERRWAAGKQAHAAYTYADLDQGQDLEQAPSGAAALAGAVRLGVQAQQARQYSSCTRRASVWSWSAGSGSSSSSSSRGFAATAL